MVLLEIEVRLRWRAVELSSPPESVAFDAEKGGGSGGSSAGYAGDAHGGEGGKEEGAKRAYAVSYFFFLLR